MSAVPKSELAWVLADYVTQGEEPPARLAQRPEACEGELMTDAEVETYIYDGIMALRVMNQANSRRFSEVRDYFIADLAFLVEIGRLDEDDYNELLREENYRL